MMGIESLLAAFLVVASLGLPAAAMPGMPLPSPAALAPGRASGSIQDFGADLTGFSKPVRSQPSASAGADCPGASRSLDVAVPSAALGKPVAVRLYMPPCQPAAGRCFASIYLLHGAGTDQTQWSDIGMASAADDGRARGTLPPLILVIPFRPDDRADARPDGDLPYEHFVVAELMPWVDQHTPACPVGAQRAIGGISMGGLWALEIAFHHPELFAAVGGNSALAQGQGGLNPFGLLASNPAAIRTLHVWLDVGDQDNLKMGDANLAAALKAGGVSTVFNQWPGSHNRAYWRQHVSDYLAFYASQFAHDP